MRVELLLQILGGPGAPPEFPPLCRNPDSRPSICLLCGSTWMATRQLKPNVPESELSIHPKLCTWDITESPNFSKQSHYLPRGSSQNVLSPLQSLLIPQANPFRSNSYLRLKSVHKCVSTAHPKSGCQSSSLSCMIASASAPFTSHCSRYSQ